MLKRIALTVVFVVSAALVGVSVVKANAPAIKVVPEPPRGFCIPPGVHC
jgi:hypothetical protein